MRRRFWLYGRSSTIDTFTPRRSFIVLYVLRLLLSYYWICCITTNVIGNEKDSNEFMMLLYQAYPKLSACGGFELMWVTGASRSKDVVLLQCPNKRYTVKYLRHLLDTLLFSTIINILGFFTGIWTSHWTYEVFILWGDYPVLLDEDSCGKLQKVCFSIKKCLHNS